MDPELVSKTAKHEAAHAVMRWLQGMEPTGLKLHATSGLSEASGVPERAQDLLLVTLAGFAWESGCGLAGLNLAASHTVDFDQARELLRQFPNLRYRVEKRGGKMRSVFEHVDTALKRWFNKACDELLPHTEVIEVLGEALEEKHELSRFQVAAIIRENVET
jgi:hypothetical protein